MLPRFLQVYLIKFFAPWCGHCKVGGGAGPSTLRYCHHVPACVRVPSPCPSTFPPPARLLQRLAPTWDQLADHFKESQQVVIASVDWLASHEKRARQALAAGWDLLLVDEGDIEQAVLMLLEIEKTVVEGAGAAGLAALLKEPAAGAAPAGPARHEHAACIEEGANGDRSSARSREYIRFARARWRAVSGRRQCGLRCRTGLSPWLPLPHMLEMSSGTRPLTLGGGSLGGAGCCNWEAAGRQREHTIKGAPSLRRLAVCGAVSAFRGIKAGRLQVQYAGQVAGLAWGGHGGGGPALDDVGGGGRLGAWQRCPNELRQGDGWVAVGASQQREEHRRLPVSKHATGYGFKAVRG